MIEPLRFTVWHWTIFVCGVVTLLALDLRVLHRRPRAESFATAFGWTALWFGMAMLFACFVGVTWGKEHALQFAAGYLVELSLSMDNVFVMSLIFAYFTVPSSSQHRVLFFGILGAMLLRGLMIWVGVELVHRLAWMLEAFGAFLVVSGVKMAFSNHQEVQAGKNPLIKLGRRVLPLSSDFVGQQFVTHVAGRRVFTPLVLVLIAVETSDLVFALDSIPAVFGVTHEPFLIFTSNVFAILGLRSLYFLLAGAIRFFRYLKTALALVLSFIGAKMLVARWLAVPTSVCLFVIAGVFALATIASVVANVFERRAKRLGCTEKPF